MNEAFEAGLDLDKCAEVGEARDRAVDALAGLEAVGRGGPRVGLELLEAERDFVGLGIDFEDAQRKLLADGEHVFRLGDAGAGDVADVEQAVNSADVDECAVGHEGADRAGNRVALFERGAAVGERAAGLLFENHAAIDDYVFVGHIELGDAAGDLCADKGFELGGVAGSAAAGGHEGADADVDAEAALDDGGDGSGDGDFFGEGALKGRPVAGLRHAEARELVVAFLVAAGDGDGERVAGFDAFGVRGEGRTRQNAFGLVADVEKDLIGGERDDRALQLFGFCGAMRVRALEGRKRVGKGLGGFFRRHGLCVQALVFGGCAGGFRNGFGCGFRGGGLAVGLAVQALVFVGRGRGGFGMVE